MLVVRAQQTAIGTLPGQRDQPDHGKQLSPQAIVESNALTLTRKKFTNRLRARSNALRSNRSVESRQSAP